MKVHDLGVGWLALAEPGARLSFGGTRITPTVDREEVVELAAAMQRKLSLHGVPIGGAKAGLRAPPEDAAEAIAILGRRARELLAERVVLGKDMGATTALIDGLYEAAGVAQLAPVRARHPACPPRLRELRGYRPRMTALGVLWSASEAFGELRGARVAVQGWGVVGAGSAWRLREAGAEIVAASDVRGVTRRPDPEAALGQRGGPPEALFGIDCDVLVLAAAPRSVDAAAAERVRARLVVEASNVGLTEDARRVLARRGVALVPDEVASSSSAAMVGWQLASGNGLPAGELWARIEAAIRRGARAAARAAPG